MAKFLPESKPLDFHDYVVYRNVRIPMSDGVELATDIYFPSKNGVVDFNKKYPVAMNRSAYMDGSPIMVPIYFEYFLAERGYVVILNAARGTYLSDGVYQPGANEGWGGKTDGYGDKMDGVDTMAWIVKQPWCNGKVVTCGMSYLGNTQYALQLTGDVPGLVTSAINCPAMNSIDGGWIYTGEFIDASCIVFWAIGRAMEPGLVSKLSKEAQEGILADNQLLGDVFSHPERFTGAFFAELEATYSYREMPIARHLPFYQAWLDNRDNPEFFAYNDTRTRKHDMKKPVLFQAGWYDLFSLNALNGYKKMVEDAPSEEVAKGHRLIVGPWNHNYSPLVRRFPESETDERLFCMEWFEQQVNGITSEFFRDNPVSLFVMGENRWRSEQTWPLADAVPTKYYIHSNGSANTLMGTGTLSLTPPAAEENQDKYMYDPANPVASPGGNGVVSGGQCDQRAVEMRPDVLVYTSEVLEEDVEVTGYVKATLYAATSATDTDFYMKLLDVTPEGIVYNVVTGGRRGRYLKNGRSKPEALTPGEINEYNIELRATSYVFKKGHQIRIDITSSDSLCTDVNPNAFIDLNSCTKADYVVAAQTVYHDAARPTSIELPIIPASHERKWLDPWPFSAKLTGVDAGKSALMLYAPQSQPAASFDALQLPTE